MTVRDASSTLARRRLVLLDQVGRGGFGEVYEGRVETPGGLSRRVAVKLLRDDIADEDTVARTIDEAHLLARLRHPAVVGVEDLVRVDGRLAIVSEFVEGVDLGATEPLPPGAAVDVIGRVAEALHAAWASPGPDGRPLHIVHRDVKPSNVRLGRGGVVKLLDFGIARTAAHTRRAQTGTGLMVGSMGYIAPERWLTDGAGHPSDVYALGCVLYEAVTGDPLFQRLPAVRQVTLMQSADVHGGFVAQRLDDAALDGPVRDLLEALLAWEPEARPTARDVARRCRRLAAGLEGDLVDWSGRLDLPARDWSRAEGRVLTETDGGFVLVGGVHPATPDDEVPATPPGRRGATWPWVVGGAAVVVLVGLTGLSLVGVLGGAAFAGGWWSAGPDGSAAIDEAGPVLAGTPDPAVNEPVDDGIGEGGPEVPPSQASEGLGLPPQPGGTASAMAVEPAVPTSSSAGGSVGVTDVDASADPAAEPTGAADGTTAPTTAPAPSPVAAAAPARVPAPVATSTSVPSSASGAEGRVDVEGQASVRLADGQGRTTVPGDVPAGRYTIEASFSGGPFKEVGTVEVPAGGAVRLRCPLRFRTCRVEGT